MGEYIKNQEEYSQREESYDVSVIVCDYKPIWEKYKRTLDAILCQRELKIQIILCDDGLRDNLFENAAVEDVIGKMVANI